MKKNTKVKIGQIISIIVLFFSTHSRAVVAEKKVCNEHVSLIENLIEDNRRYSQDVTTKDIIQWEDEVVNAFLARNDYKRIFLMKQMVVCAYSLNGQITEALRKSNAMLIEAQKMKYDIGIALSHFALGETYFNATMSAEAINEYKMAAGILSKTPRSEQLQERVLIQLIPLLIKQQQMEDAKDYLGKLSDICEHSKLNPFLLYAYQAYYYLCNGDVKMAQQYITDAQIINNENPSSYRNSILTFIQAEYAQQTGDYGLALKLYNTLANSSGGISVYNIYMKINESIAQTYSKQGHYKEACETYNIINDTRDSINAHNYTAQINLLRTIYQVDNIAVDNQKQWNRVLYYLIIGSILILTITIAFVIRIRRENRRLAVSKVNLSEALKNAESSIRTKSLFLSNMSHEIRTPLNALSGFSSILTDGNIDLSIRQQCNEIIQQNSDLLSKLIDDVVDLSSLERGKMQFQMDIHDAVSLCRNVIDTVEKIKQTTATVSFDTSLKELKLYTDEARLQQLLINLLINATKFTTEGNITLTLEIKDGAALFAVTDTGCGISPEKQSKIFNRFEKLNENAQGSGLGLSICQLIIEHFGGKIWIDTEYKNGSRFLFTHPLCSETTKKEAVL